MAISKEYLHNKGIARVTGMYFDLLRWLWVAVVDEWVEVYVVDETDSFYKIKYVKPDCDSFSTSNMPTLVPKGHVQLYKPKCAHC